MCILTFFDIFGQIGDFMVETLQKLPLGGLLEASGGLWGPKLIWGGFGGLWGSLWGPLGAKNGLWGPLGKALGVFGKALEALGRLWEGFGRLWEESARPPPARPPPARPPPARPPARPKIYIQTPDQPLLRPHIIIIF